MYTPVPHQYRKVRLDPSDLIVLGLFIFLIYGSVITAERWHAELQPSVSISLSTGSLALYSVYSLFRAVIAYILSLAFTLVFGYLAGKFKAAEQAILPMLDIGQSIPVLGFLPGLVLGLMALFPHNNLGLELACILMIFTGQVWNMTFSFYSSIKSVPKHFHELSDNIQLSFMQRLLYVELPYSSSGLAWNSLMSMAGGWFFLTVCEAFTLGDKEFRLPGLGSYMAIAIEKGETGAMIQGVIAMIILIVGMDFMIWRPIIAWTRRFRLDEQQDDPQEIPFFQLLLKDSKILRLIQSLTQALWHADAVKKRKSLEEQDSSKISLRRLQRNWHLQVSHFLKHHKYAQSFISKLTYAVLGFMGVWISAKVYNFLHPLNISDYLLIAKSSLITFIRVIFTLVISTLWTVPFGLWVGLSQKRTQIFQPFIQVAASFPAPMLYPIALAILGFFSIGIGMGSAILMLLGVQWYVLFNVLAGTTMISRELQDTFRIAGLSKRDTWLNLYLPSIFPSLVTGWVTAAGGAWNASIVAEYILYRGNLLKASGLGALISDATAHGNYALLAGSLLAMVIVVVGFNRMVWHKLYQLVERRFKFER